MIGVAKSMREEARLAGSMPMVDHRTVGQNGERQEGVAFQVSKGKS